MTVVGIVGSRHWSDYEAFEREIRKLSVELAGTRRIVSGGASGVDQMAWRFAYEERLSFDEYRPKKGRDPNGFTPAAMERNQQIVDASDWLIAMPGPKSKGTWDTIRRAQKKGIRVVIIEAPE